MSGGELGLGNVGSALGRELVMAIQCGEMIRRIITL